MFVSILYMYYEVPHPLYLSLAPPLVVVVTNRMFAVLLNQYAGAHNVQEAIEVFYLRKDYGFELDLVGFHILLMSLCRYKHVGERGGAVPREER